MGLALASVMPWLNYSGLVFGSEYTVLDEGAEVVMFKVVLAVFFGLCAVGAAVLPKKLRVLGYGAVGGLGAVAIASFLLIAVVTSDASELLVTVAPGSGVIVGLFAGMICIGATGIGAITHRRYSA